LALLAAAHSEVLLSLDDCVRVKYISSRRDCVVDETRWDEKAGLRRDAVRSQGIDVLESTDQSKETGNEEG